ncbi:amino acid permease, partial [Pseudomonas syringae pv. tagetis]|uniref:amino acid permease n=1 Tax=Pseudomonas syringae group genomosp. 7 TaxID=251699 RepID=UPI00376F642F
VLYAAAGDGTMPAFLGRENARGVPANALWLSNGLIQVFLLLVLVNSGSYTGLVLLAAIAFYPITTGLMSDNVHGPMALYG